MISAAVRITFIILTTLSLVGCGINYEVTGKVVDATTRKPVEGAVVSVYWVRTKLQIPMGLPPNRERYGTSECITDAQGKFKVLKYPFASHYLGVYKQGYICWSSEKIYNPMGKTREEKYIDRKHHQVNDWMVIELAPVKGENFPVLEHAMFVDNIIDRVHGRKFSDITINERNLVEHYLRKKWGKEK